MDALPYSIYNEYDNEIAASCLIDLGCRPTHRALSDACKNGSANLVRLLLPHLNPNDATPWCMLPLTAAMAGGQKHVIEILLADPRLTVDKHDAEQLREPDLVTWNITTLLCKRDKTFY